MVFCRRDPYNMASLTLFFVSLFYDNKWYRFHVAVHLRYTLTTFWHYLWCLSQQGIYLSVEYLWNTSSNSHFFWPENRDQFLMPPCPLDYTVFKWRHCNQKHFSYKNLKLSVVECQITKSNKGTVYGTISFSAIS